MEERSFIHIDTDVQVISARGEVRNLARKLGFNPMEQARISLVTSALAYSLGLGSGCTGYICIGTAGKGDGGVEIECVAYFSRMHQNSPPLDLESLESKLTPMVDTLKIEELPSRDVRVVMVKLNR